MKLLEFVATYEVPSTKLRHMWGLRTSRRAFGRHALVRKISLHNPRFHSWKLGPSQSAPDLQ